MKILMVNKFLYQNGGSETYIFKLGDYLKSIGHQVEYFGMEHEGRIVSNSCEQYTSNMDFHSSNKLSKITYPIKTIYSRESFKKIKIVLNAFKPDVVHLNNFNFQLTPSIIVAIKQYEKESKTRVKIIYTAHDYQLVCPNHAMLVNYKACEKCIGGNFKACVKNSCIHSSKAKSLIGACEAYYWNGRNIYSNIDTIICPTAFMKSRLDTNPVLKAKTVVMKNFIQRVEDKDVLKEDYILYFGRYSKEKGIELLISANCKNLVCAGSGALEEEINNSPSIKNVGFKTGEELEELIRKACLCVCPSICYENCPFSVMESITYGTPVVASNIGGIPELVQNGKTGYLFEPNNLDDFKDKINLILNDKENAKRLSENCKKTNFDTIESYAQKLLEIYK